MTKLLNSLVVLLALAAPAASALTVEALVAQPFPEVPAQKPEAAPAAVPVQKAAVVQERKVAAPAKSRAGATVVEPAVRVGTVTGADVEQALQTLVQQKFQLNDGEFRLQLVRPFAEVGLETHGWRVEATEFPADGPAPTFLMRFKLWNGAKLLGEFQVPVRCELWRDTYVATRQVARGTALTMADFAVQPVDMLRLKGSPVTVPFEFEAHETVQTVAAGKPLQWRDVGPRPLVRKGEMVEIHATEGALHLTLRALALENGNRGDFISVRNLNSKRDLQVQVVDKKKAKLFF